LHGGHCQSEPLSPLASADAIVALPNHRANGEGDGSAAPFQPCHEISRHPRRRCRHARGRAPAPTVLSEGEWLAVSIGSESGQRGQLLEHLVKKLVQNALDSVGDSGRIDLDIRPAGPRQAVVCCIDDGLGAEDLSLLNGAVVTGQKDVVTRRGRMGCRFNELPSVVKHAIVCSHGQELLFVTEDDGTWRVTHRCGLERRQGFNVAMHIEHDAAGKGLGSHFRSFLPPAGVVLTVNCSATARMAGRVASPKNAPETPGVVAAKCTLVS